MKHVKSRVRTRATKSVVQHARMTVARMRAPRLGIVQARRHVRGLMMSGLRIRRAQARVLMVHALRAAVLKAGRVLVRMRAPHERMHALIAEARVQGPRQIGPTAVHSAQMVVQVVARTRALVGDLERVLAHHVVRGLIKI
jgi:hypothetical protein